MEMNIIDVTSIFNDYEQNINTRLSERDEYLLCRKIFDYLITPSSFRLNYVTYGTLKQVTNCSDVEFPNLVKATDFLTTRNAHLLDMYFEYCDEFMDEPEPIEKQDVHIAITEGRFYHPINGETISNFSSYIYPVFRPSDELLFYRELKVVGE